jgi:hypothetical protein
MAESVRPTSTAVCFPSREGTNDMTEHKFTVGQVVQARASLFGLTPPGPYEIIRLIPSNGASNQYRLKSLKNGNEWVVREEDMFRSDN